jgi:hypothetical protein
MAEAQAAAAAAPDWRAGLPDDVKAAPALKDIADVGTLAKNYLEAQGALGRSLRLPSKEAGDADRKAFRAKVLELGKDYGVAALPAEGEDPSAFYALLGRPGKPEEYEVPDGKAAGVEFDPGEAQQFKAIAHAAGLTKRQFNKIIGDMSKSRVDAAVAQRAAADAAAAELKAEWGEAYEPRLADTARRLEMHGAPPALVSAWKGGKIDAGSARWLHAMMSALGDEPAELQNQGKRPNGNALAPEEAMARVEEIEKRLQAMSPSDPDYQGLVQRRVQLIERAAAGRS